MQGGNFSLSHLFMFYFSPSSTVYWTFSLTSQLSHLWAAVKNNPMAQLSTAQACHCRITQTIMIILYHCVHTHLPLLCSQIWIWVSPISLISLYLYLPCTCTDTCIQNITMLLAIYPNNHSHFVISYRKKEKIWQCRGGGHKSCSSWWVVIHYAPSLSLQSCQKEGEEKDES